MTSTNRPIRIANCSGFYGDRLAGAREMVEGGPIDALTGDWLAELTMLILAKSSRGGRGGFARTFVQQMEQVMGTCLDKGIKVVANAGGLDPAGCAEAVHEVAQKLGLSPKIAYVAGDDVLPRLGDLRAAGNELANLDTGELFGDRVAMTANAYLGCWGAVDALNRGADIVITGRTTDAAVVMAPAAWHHGWQRNDWDALAGAVVAGHLIECSAQVTGGNYAFFQEVPGLEYPGFPIAEIAADGSSVITKHEGTGGLVSVGTVTAQLLYEITGERYLNPDVVTRFDTIRLEQEGRDRVRVSGVKGEPAPETLKVCINYEGGFRNRSTFLLTGLDIEDKADLVERTFWKLAGGKDKYDFAKTELRRTDKPDAAANVEAVAELIFTVKDRDGRKVGRQFSNAGVMMALGSYPGMFGRGGPGAEEAYGVYWPTLIPADTCAHEVVVDGKRAVIDGTQGPFDPVQVVVPSVQLPAASTGPTRPTPVGRIMGARSGDKGGNANVGVWARSAEAYAWLRQTLTVDQVRQMMPVDTAGLEIRRYELPNIWSINFVIVGILEEGVASATRLDAQAKGLGEYLRSRVLDIPESLLVEPHAFIPPSAR